MRYFRNNTVAIVLFLHSTPPINDPQKSLIFGSLPYSSEKRLQIEEEGLDSVYAQEEQLALRQLHTTKHTVSGQGKELMFIEHLLASIVHNSHLLPPFNARRENQFSYITGRC